LQLEVFEIISRFILIALVTAASAGCSTVSDGNPSPEGKDALGHQIFQVGGDRLAVLEAKANSQCPGTTRPYVQSIAGYGDDVTLNYTCE